VKWSTDLLFSAGIEAYDTTGSSFHTGEKKAVWTAAGYAKRWSV